MNQKIKNLLPAKKILLLLILVFGFWGFGENIKANNNCTNSSPWGAKCDQGNGVLGYCYQIDGNPTCTTEKGILNGPCGDSGGICKKSVICFDSYGLCCPSGFSWDDNGRNCNGTLVCCTPYEGCTNKKWGDECVNGYCYDGKCETGIGATGDPCGDEEGSTCQLNSECKTQDLDGRSCMTNYTCCKKGEVKNKCEETESSGCVPDGTCSTTKGTDLGKLGCPTGKTCCNYNNDKKTACQILEGECKEECSSGYTKSISNEANLSCNNEYTTSKCCVKKNNDDLAYCLHTIGGKCQNECASGFEKSEDATANKKCQNFLGDINANCCTNTDLCGKINGKCQSNECANGFIKSEKNSVNEYCNKKITGNFCCVPESVITPGKVKMESFGWDYPNPLSVNSFTEWISNLLASIQGITAWLAVLMIFIGGIMYILSGGSQSQATLAKDIIKWALVGFALAVAAPALLKEIKELVSSGTGSAAGLIDKANTFKKIVTNILSFLLTIVGTLSLIGMAVGGGMYLFSGGSDQSNKAKKMILYSVVAFAVSSAGIIILNAIIAFLSANKTI